MDIELFREYCLSFEGVMEKNNSLKAMSKYLSILFGVIFAGLSAFAQTVCVSAGVDKSFAANDALRSEMRKIVNSAPGKVGIALIKPDGDTITVNNEPHYQMMSVFKLHQALAVAHTLDLKGVSLDTVVNCSRNELNPDTWSPMLKEHKELELQLTVSELLRYIIQLSDNNASNLLFDRIVSVNDCDRFIRNDLGINDFSIAYSERQMHADHSLADGNYSSPLSCALLMKKVFTDSILSIEKQTAIQELLLDCQTGRDRLYVPLNGNPKATLAHKTGSGFRDNTGKLMAHNDIGRIMLPDGRSYVLAVMVKDFDGSEEEASSLIAKVSTLVFDTFNN